MAENDAANELLLIKDICCKWPACPCKQVKGITKMFALEPQFSTEMSFTSFV